MVIYPNFQACSRELRELGYQSDTVARAYDYIHRVLGIEWPARELERCRGHLFRSHPLLNVFGTASVSSISLALELALALKVSEKDPGLETLVQDLRQEDAFAGATFTLSVALRFHLMGFEVQLERPAQRESKSDVYATRGHERYMIECTTRPGLRVEKTNRFLHLEILEKSGLQTSSLIDFEVQLVKGMEQEATSLYKEILVKYAQTLEPLSLVGGTLRVSARPLAAHEIRDPRLSETLSRDWDWTNIFSGSVDDQPLIDASHADILVAVRARESDGPRSLAS